MCGCDKHNNKSAQCTCICPEHANFKLAFELAMSRYHKILELVGKIAELELKVAQLEADPFCDQCSGPHTETPWLMEQYGGHWDTCPNRARALAPEGDPA